MASGVSQPQEYDLSSVVRGHHIYKDVWTPIIGEQLLVEKEEGNEHDTFAIALLKDNSVVGHMPKELSHIARHFLSHEGVITCTITGHRKFGKGLEVPCTYSFSGKSKIVFKLQRLLS